jgi:hypothetical protein
MNQSELVFYVEKAKELMGKIIKYRALNEAVAKEYLFLNYTIGAGIALAGGEKKYPKVFAHLRNLKTNIEKSFSLKRVIDQNQ